MVFNTVLIGMLKEAGYNKKEMGPPQPVSNKT